MSMIDLSATEQKIAARIDSGVTDRFEVSTAAGGLGFANMGQAMEFAKMMAISSVAVPKHLRGNVGACLAVVIQAVEWKLSPYAVANKSYSVNDRLAYESQLIQAVILQRAPIKGRFKVEYTGQGDARVCKVWAKLREGDEVVDYESPPFGKITPKNSPLWKSDPDQQHFYYSGRALCRRHFPDVLLGVYADDELSDPEHARDITPAPRSIADKLDVLAAQASKSAAPEDTKAETVAEASASSGGEAVVETGGASPAAEQASPPETSGQASATNVAAPEQQQDGAKPSPAASGAAAPEQTSPSWPAGEVPKTPEQYALFARTWFARVAAGAMTPADAELQWKGDRPSRNKCAVPEEMRDELHAELKAILAAKKAG